MATPTTYVEPPARNERRGGLLTVASIVDNVERLGVGVGIEYVANPCGGLSTTPAECWGDQSVADGTAKTFRGLNVSGSIIPSFGGYFGVACFLNDDSDFDTRAQSGLELGEGRHIEAFLAGWLNGATTTGTGTDIVDAIAKVDNFADTLPAGYIGLPIIHINRGDADRALAAHVLVADGLGGLSTANGTPVVASGVYPVGTVFGSGWVTVYRSAITVTRANDLLHNKEMAIAERGYGLAVDCDYRIKVTIS